MTEIQEVAAAIYNAHMSKNTEKLTQVQVAQLVRAQMPGESASIMGQVVDALLDLQKEGFDAVDTVATLNAGLAKPATAETMSTGSPFTQLIQHMKSCGWVMREDQRVYLGEEGPYEGWVDAIKACINITSARFKP